MWASSEATHTLPHNTQGVWAPNGSHTLWAPLNDPSIQDVANVVQDMTDKSGEMTTIACLLAASPTVTFLTRAAAMLAETKMKQFLTKLKWAVIEAKWCSVQQMAQRRPLAPLYNPGGASYSATVKFIDGMGLLPFYAIWCQNEPKLTARDLTNSLLVVILKPVFSSKSKTRLPPLSLASTSRGGDSTQKTRLPPVLNKFPPLHKVDNTLESRKDEPFQVDDTTNTLEENNTVDKNNALCTTVEMEETPILSPPSPKRTTNTLEDDTTLPLAEDNDKSDLFPPSGNKCRAKAQSTGQRCGGSICQASITYWKQKMGDGASGTFCSQHHNQFSKLVQTVPPSQDDRVTIKCGGKKQSGDPCGRQTRVVRSSSQQQWFCFQHQQ